MQEEGGGLLTPVWASLSSRGGRAENQDRCGDAATPGGRAFVVADGLGGHAGGAAAAAAAVEASLDALKGPGLLGRERLQHAFEAAQHAVQDAPRRDPAAEGCRTTAVVLEIARGRAVWGHLGDTRLYHFRGGAVAHQTLDHSMPQALVQTGAIRPEEIRRHPDRNRLLKSLGGEGEAAPTLLEEPIALAAGDAFLLCTDGFWEFVTEEDMLAALGGASGPAEWLERMENGLLHVATGSHDNYSATAVLLRDRGARAAAPRGVGKALLRLLAAALLGAALAGAWRCAQGPAGPHPLILSGPPAGCLPVCEALPTPRSGPRLHSVPADPPGGVGS
jgi:serine/threonine protein phosphatase PrpC